MLLALWLKYLSFFKETMRKAYLENALPRLLKFINRRLEGGKQWLVGNKVSHKFLLNSSLLTRLTRKCIYVCIKKISIYSHVRAC